jgi:hypothetical protein
MRRYVLLALAAMLGACAKTVLVSVPPRLRPEKYETPGIVEFASTAGRASRPRAPRPR